MLWSLILFNSSLAFSSTYPPVNKVIMSESLVLEQYTLFSREITVDIDSKKYH